MEKVFLKAFPDRLNQIAYIIDGDYILQNTNFCGDMDCLEIQPIEEMIEQQNPAEVV